METLLRGACEHDQLTRTQMVAILKERGLTGDDWEYLLTLGFSLKQIQRLSKYLQEQP